MKYITLENLEEFYKNLEAELDVKIGDIQKVLETLTTPPEEVQELSEEGGN